MHSPYDIFNTTTIAPASVAIIFWPPFGAIQCGQNLPCRFVWFPFCMVSPLPPNRCLLGRRVYQWLFLVFSHTLPWLGGIFLERSRRRGGGARAGDHNGCCPQQKISIKLCWWLAGLSVLPCISSFAPVPVTKTSLGHHEWLQKCKPIGVYWDCPNRQNGGTRCTHDGLSNPSVAV